MYSCSPTALQDLRNAGARQIVQQRDFSLGDANYGCPDDCVGNYMYGLIETGIAGGASGTPTANPQKRNQPRRLFLSESVADNFLIDSLEVGVENLLATSGQISAAIFIPNSNVGDFRRVVCDPVISVTARVTNISGAVATFASTVLAYQIA
jgi:hypothetical protein